MFLKTEKEIRSAVIKLDEQARKPGKRVFQTLRNEATRKSFSVFPGAPANTF